ncbi:MAG: TFIIB-type zinc ribbon-containing protein, partial [Candidatus Micrarchaeota archaeon]
MESKPEPTLDYEAQQASEATTEPRRCPSCGSTDIVYDAERGELVCNNCGLVIEENVTDTGPEWRAFDADQRNTRSRTGAPIKYMKPN